MPWKVVIAAVLMFAAARQVVSQAVGPGNLDSSFKPPPLPFVQAVSMFLQPDSKLLVAGYANRVVEKSVVRLNPNGTLDTGFQGRISSFTVVEMYALSLLKNGKILLGCQYSPIAPSSGGRPQFVLLMKSDGSVQDSPPQPHTDGRVLAVAALSDGKALIGGEFSLVNGVAQKRLARINADGTLDSTFSIGTGIGGVESRITAMALQPDGKLIVAGEFSLVRGVARQRIARLNADLTVDESFDPQSALDFGIPTFSGFGVDFVLVQPSGRIIVAAGPYTLRLESDGAVDGSFHAVVTVRGAMTQSDARIVVAGPFGFCCNGVRRNGVARLNDDGSLDTSFDTPGTSAYLNALVVQPDGRLVVGGILTDGSGTQGAFVARLHTEASLRPPRLEAVPFATPGSGQLRLRLTGATNQLVVVQVSNDLTEWTNLSTNTLLNGFAEATDPKASSFGRRFYRAFFRP